MNNQPDPSRIVEGLRDTGYTLNTSVADVIDNSVSHGTAENIYIDASMNIKGEIKFAFIDNGSGMDHIGLINAMKYGSKRPKDPNSLGKYGMGLKTASSAFCRRFSLISKDKDNSDFTKVTWDLDHIAQKNDWDMLEPDLTESDNLIINKYLGKKRGTILLWEKVDKIVREYADPGGRFAQNALLKQLEDLKFHLSMVYYQFLDKNNKAVADISIKMNNDIIKPWDPFCQNEEKTDLLAKEEIKVTDQNNDTVGEFNVTAYAIPNMYNFSSDEAREEAKLSNNMQGFYVYRHGRLIYHGGWLGIRHNEPHLTLARVKLEFDHKLDDAFKLDIKKSRIMMDEGIVNHLKNELLGAPSREADKKYRKGKKTNTHTKSKDAHHDSNILISKKEEEVSSSKKNVIDKNTGEAEITNKEGTTRVVLKIVEPEKNNELHIITVPSLEDGILWEPTIHEQKAAVLLNTSHIFYDRVYVPNHNESVTIQGLDALLWSLAEAEYSTFNEKTKKAFETLRYEVSKILREITSDLPES